MPHPFDWKLLTSRYVVHDRWLKVRVDTCELPSARVIEPYYVLEYPTWLNVVALTAQEDVVLVQLYRHGIRQTVLELPSGTVESSDASVLDAARRELLEETGYGGGEFVETACLSPNTANHVNSMHCFVATGVERVQQPVIDETERVETVLLPLRAVVELAKTNGLLQALHVSSLFFALHTLGRLHIT
jgi:ADP-ribose pyrophosphatase